MRIEARGIANTPGPKKKKKERIRDPAKIRFGGAGWSGRFMRKAQEKLGGGVPKTTS